MKNGQWGQDSGGIGGLTAITEVSGTSTNIFVPVCDHAGTVYALVAAVTNNVTLSTPLVVATYDYTPFGDQISADGIYAKSCPFAFNSRYRDSETTLLYYGYRFYDPRCGKWLTEDPIQEAGGLDMTCFCGNDPVNQVDPTGLAMDYRKYLGPLPWGHGDYVVSDASILTKDGLAENLWGAAYNLTVALPKNIMYGTMSGVGQVATVVDNSPKIFGVSQSISQLQEPLGPYAFMGGGGELKMLMGVGMLERELTMASTFAREESVVAKAATTVATKPPLVVSPMGPIQFSPAAMADLQASLARKPLTSLEPATAAKNAIRVLSDAERTLYGRVSHPNGFRELVWERAKSPDGNVYDPSGRIMKFNEPWELGHLPEHKFSDVQLRAAREGWPREMWRKYQNDPDIYRPELPSSNASHQWE
jgi:RHS repeat-associated protein